MSVLGAQLPAAYIHQDLRIIVPSTRIVKEDIREEVQERFWRQNSGSIGLFSILFPGPLINHKQWLAMDWEETIPIIFLECFFIWYINSLLMLIAPLYTNVFYQRECGFILNISVAIGTVVLSLSTAAGKLEEGKAGTYGSNYQPLPMVFELDFTFLDWAVWKDHLLRT